MQEAAAFVSRSLNEGRYCSGDAADEDKQKRPGYPERFRNGGGLRSRLGFYYIRSLGSLLSFNDLELYSITFSKGFEAATSNRAVVNEDVRTTLPREESVTFRVIEPLNGTGDARHDALSSPYRGLTVMRDPVKRERLSGYRTFGAIYERALIHNTTLIVDKTDPGEEAGCGGRESFRMRQPHPVSPTQLAQLKPPPLCSEPYGRISRR